MAATKRYNVLDMNGNQIQNVLLQVLASDPGSPANGQIWYNSTTNTVNIRINGVTIPFGRIDQLAAPTAAWSNGSQRITNVADPTSAQDAATRAYVLARALSDFTGSVAVDLALNAHKLTGVADPTGPQDAATKAYVDSLVSGLDWKVSARAATTAAGTLATSFANGQVIDGVTLATGDRILIKNQAAGAENGIYTVNASGAPTRATDADVSAEVTSGMAVPVNEGTANADSVWILTTNDPITLGTTALVFSKAFTAGQAAGTVNKFSALIGDGSTTSIVVTDGIGSQDKVAIVRDATSNAQIECDIVYNSTTQTTFNFTVAPTTNQFRVVVVG